MGGLASPGQLRPVMLQSREVWGAFGRIEHSAFDNWHNTNLEVESMWNWAKAWVVGVSLGAVQSQLPAVLSSQEEWWTSNLSELVSRYATSVRVERIGQSTLGKPIDAVWVTRGDGVRRPAVAILAGLDGRHVVGTKTALGVAARIAAEKPDLLQGADLVVVACANPDGMFRFESKERQVDTGANAAARKTAREDADRDRRIDEDGAVDMNGDGVISMMRIRRPRAGLVPGLVATEIAEADDARLLRRADANKGELAEWAVLSEGLDQDGDGRIAEDGAEGVDLDSNFPYHWPEFDDDAGPTPLSEPESRSIAKWLLAHAEIVAVVIYGPNDNLINLPANGKMDPTGEAPISGGVLDEDQPVYEFVGKKFKDITKMTGVGGGGGGVGRSFDGSLQGWAYAQLGVASFVTPVWVRPDLVNVDENKDDKPKVDKADDDKDKKKGADSDDRKWILLSDRRAAAGGPAGFIEWTPFDHPQLGRIEIGGWIPGFRLNPPDSEVEPLIDRQTAFINELMRMLPRLTIDEPTIERLGEQLWRVRVRVVNEGVMPTRIAMGVKTRRLPATRWEIDLPAERVVSGSRVQSKVSIAGSGGQLVGEWVVVGVAGGEVKVRLLSSEYGDRELTVGLQAAMNGQELEGKKPNE